MNRKEAVTMMRAEHSSRVFCVTEQIWNDGKINKTITLFHPDWLTDSEISNGPNACRLYSGDKWEYILHEIDSFEIDQAVGCSCCGNNGLRREDAVDVSIMCLPAYVCKTCNEAHMDDIRINGDL